MKAAPGKLWIVPFAGLLGIFLTSTPLLAQESSPSAADTTVGTVFRWLNFLIVFGGLAYVIGKFGAPYFRGQAQSIAGSIQQAAEARAAAERELQEANRQLAALDLEVQDLRRAAVRESAAEAERLRELTRVESEKIAQAARGEIAAAERVARQELRALTAKLATEEAAVMVREQITAAAEATLFYSFLGALERSAS
jgi:F0F1-type ATP synthase membrane subunit b/b'